MYRKALFLCSVKIKKQPTMKKLIFAALVFMSISGFSHGDEKTSAKPIPVVSHQSILNQFSDLFKEGDAAILQGYITNSFTLILHVNERGVLELDNVMSENPKLINYATEAYKNEEIKLDSTFVGEKLVYTFKIN